MALAALALYVLFALLAFAWRAWLQLQRSAVSRARSCRLRGWGASCSQRAGSPRCSPRSRPSSRKGASQRLPLPEPVRAVGLALMAVGIVLTLIAQIEMGASWRVGVDPSEMTDLVTTGLFAWVRNPIYTAMLTALLGLVLAVPNVLAAVAFFVAFVGLELHVRKVEEPYLLRRHPEGFRAYARRVGRFVPRVARIA